jgi:two-component system nitrogen regulation response regulator GlnG
VDEGRFRADLLHRLDVVRLQLPPLRERRDDVPRLAERFLAVAARRFDAPPKRFAKPALERLRGYGWPGNVRELENLCWRLAALAPDDTITAADLDGMLASDAAPHAGNDWESRLAAWARERLAAGADDLHADARARLEQVLFDAALAHTGGHRGEAAARLGLGRNTLSRRLGSGRKRR